MGSTPRRHRYQVPMTTRSTDVSTIADCPGAFALNLLHERDKAEASYFGLGTALHETIERVIEFNHDLDYSLDLLEAKLFIWMERVEKGDRRLIETTKRGVDTMYDDGERMLRQWFRTVHPDGEKRHPIYDDYKWPPRTEVFFYDKIKKVWGSIDAIFKHKNGAELGLVDWKSSVKKQENKHQLDFYQYGYPAILGNWKSWFHNLDRKQARAIVSHIDEPYPGDSTVEWRISDAVDAKASLCDGEYPDFNPGWYCNYCPVQEFCPADGDVRNRGTNGYNLESVLHLFRPLDNPIREKEKQ